MCKEFCDVRRFGGQYDSAKAFESKMKMEMHAAMDRYAMACVESALAADRLERAKEKQETKEATANG